MSQAPAAVHPKIAAAVQPAPQASLGRPGDRDLGNRYLLRWMFAFLSPVKLLVISACVYLSLSVGAEILEIRQMGVAADQIRTLPGSSTERGFWGWFSGASSEAVLLRHAIILLGVLVVVMAALRYLREVASTRLSMKLVYYLREAVYDKLQRVGFRFHDRIPTGQLINRALGDLQNVRAFLQTAVLTTLDIVLVVAGYLVLLCSRSPWLAALSLVPLPLWTIYILRFGRKVQPASKAVMEADDRSVSVISETIAGVHVVKAFATERQEMEKYGAACDTFHERVMRRIRLYANFTPVIRAIGTASHLSLFLLVAVLLIHGKLSVGDFLIMGTAMGAILSRLQQVAAISDQYQNAIVSSRRLHEILAAAPTVPESPNARPLPEGGGAVRFEHVTFGYAADKPVLHDVSFEVPAGACVAIVGPTGAGKTTLVNLLARFYDPQQGRILIDETDIREATLSSLRAATAYVFQETYLFSASVAENIAYGRPGVGRSEIEAAARLAQAHDFIEQLPQKYDTVIGERGSSLSGGQRQRLAIARAIVQDPRILILDDATASVDPQTDDQIHRAMRSVMKSRTTFLIAHRISTVKRADVAIVLENGRITQLGTHDELMGQPGHYRQIAMAQLYGDEELDEEGDRPSHMKRMRDERQVSAVLAGKDAEPEESI